MAINLASHLPNVELYSIAGAEGYRDANVFASFDAPILTLLPHELGQMLRRPLPVKVPAYPGDAMRFPQLLQGVGGLHESSRLGAMITAALHLLSPDADASEILFSGYWDTLITAMFRIAADVTGLPLVVKRNVKETTITSHGSLRDFLVILQDRAIIHGEDKRESLNDAIRDLQKKHIGSSPYLYGDLDVCIGIATGMQCPV